MAVARVEAGTAGERVSAAKRTSVKSTKTRASTGRPTRVTYDAWAIAAPGLEPIVADELRALGFADADAQPGGVAFRCDASGLAIAQIGLRVASRVVVRIASFRATAFHELERAARKVEWGRFVSAGGRVRVRVTCRKSRLYHSDAVAQRVVEAIERTVPGATAGDTARRASASAGLDGAPKVVDEDGDDADSTSQLFLVRLDRDLCTISADASGMLLHRRGYRVAVAKAPLRETLAAAMLMGARWDPRTPLVDPLCGSGTIAIEAAMLARRISPGLARNFAAQHWPEVGASVYEAARERAREAMLPRAVAPIVGSDRDAGAIAAARANAERAGVAAEIEFIERSLSAATPPVTSPSVTSPSGAGLLIANPPYGIRIGDATALRDLFARIGQLARGPFTGWSVALLSADRALDAQVGLPFTERFRTSNGGIPVHLISTT